MLRSKAMKRKTLKYAFFMGTRQANYKIVNNTLQTVPCSTNGILRSSKRKMYLSIIMIWEVVFPNRSEAFLQAFAGVCCCTRVPNKAQMTVFRFISIAHCAGLYAQTVRHNSLLNARKLHVSLHSTETGKNSIFCIIE